MKKINAKEFFDAANCQRLEEMAEQGFHIDEIMDTAKKLSLDGEGKTFLGYFYGEEYPVEVTGLEPYIADEITEWDSLAERAAREWAEQKALELSPSEKLDFSLTRWDVRWEKKFKNEKFSPILGIINNYWWACREALADQI